MNAPIIHPDEVEQDRLRLAQELNSESGANWADEHRPGSVGCHELLDRTSMLADMVENYLVTHPACVANPEWFRLAEQAASALRDLYQKIGAEHLSADPINV